MPAFWHQDTYVSEIPSCWADPAGCGRPSSPRQRADPRLARVAFCAGCWRFHAARAAGSIQYRISQRRSNPSRAYTDRPWGDAWRITCQWPRRFASSIRARAIRLASPWPRCSGTVNIDRMYGATSRRAFSGRGCSGWYQMQPLPTASPRRVSAICPTSSPRLSRARSQRRYRRSWAAIRSSALPPIDKNIRWRWSTRVGRSDARAALNR